MACHGADAKGNQQLGAPNLTDKIWLYGGSRDKIKELGPRPFLLGVALWLILGTGWGLAARFGLLG